MNKNLIALTLLLFSLNTLYAQTNNRTEDVLYLKTQSVIRGKIISRSTAIIKIQTQDGSIYAFNSNDIDSITKEPRWKSFLYKKKGFTSFTELGPLVAGKTTINGVTTAAFSLQTVNGYKFSQYTMAGLGVGADLYATQTIIPVFASFRGDLSTAGSVIPFYFGDLGYGINITQNSPGATVFKGGLMYAAGAGIKIPFNTNAGFLLSIGYRYQKTTYTIQNTPTPVIYNRIAIRAGFFL